jgi:FemAB family
LPTLSLSHVSAVLASSPVAALRPGVPDDAWDVELQRLGGHFLQSRAWQRVQERLGYAVLCDRGDSWCWAGPVSTGPFPRYLYVPYGPAGAVDAALQSITACARARHLDFARIEPLAAPPPGVVLRLHALPAKPVQPRWTWVLDLSPDERQLRRGLSAGHRGSVNAAERRGLSFRSSDDLGDVATFLDLQRRAAGHGRYSGQSEDYYRAVVDCLVPQGFASLYFADSGSQAVAAAIAFDFGVTRYYAHAVSDPSLGRKLGAAAPLVWRMILDARAAGRKQFDFWGVAPPGSTEHRWAGFTRFKQAFGGRLLERPGAWEIPLHPLRHRLYRLARRLRT